MDKVLFFFILGGLIGPTTISILFSRGGKIREIPCAVDIYFAGGKFRAKSKFADTAIISSTRNIRTVDHTHSVLSPSIDMATSSLHHTSNMLVTTEQVSDGMVGGKLIFFEHHIHVPVIRMTDQSEVFVCRKTRVKLPPLYYMVYGRMIQLVKPF